MLEYLKRVNLVMLVVGVIALGVALFTQVADITLYILIALSFAPRFLNGQSKEQLIEIRKIRREIFEADKLLLWSTFFLNFVVPICLGFAVSKLLSFPFNNALLVFLGSSFLLSVCVNSIVATRYKEKQLR